jgi:hypothetical protein
MDARQLVERAKLSFEGMIVAPEMDGLRDLIRRAKGVFIAPQVLRGAFIFGVSGGSGVFFARSERPGQWKGPAFYTIGEASFGFQAGADASEVALLAMTDRGVNALLSTSVKLGADASVAAGPVGRRRARGHGQYQRGHRELLALEGPLRRRLGRRGRGGHARCAQRRVLRQGRLDTGHPDPGHGQQSPGGSARRADQEGGRSPVRPIRCRGDTVTPNIPPQDRSHIHRGYLLLLVWHPVPMLSNPML